ncbi:MAG: flagellar basal body P-ring formation chaperone FlgA [Firmicutes bacterium]|nr:flagellar basal body P-ring formation chaperone FlgA [Bacillota bacterium]
MRLWIVALASGLVASAALAQEPLAQRLEHEAVAYAEGHVQSGPGSYQIKALRPPILPKLPEDQVVFEPSHLSKREPTGTFFVVFRVMSKGRPAGNVRVDLEGRWTGTLLRTKGALNRRAVPTDDQVEAVPFEGTPPPGALSTLPEGHRLRHATAAGRMLTLADFEPIPLVATGDRVRVQVRFEALTIATDALARSQGVLGDRVRVELPSRKILQAVITGQGEALVEW